MIKINKIEIKACCGKKQVIWKISIPLKKEYLTIFQENGFIPVKSYTDAGMIYAEDIGLIITGILGSNELRVRCKNKNCENSSKFLEQVILTKF